MNITGSVVLITGSADRVGRHIAVHLAQKGAQVVVHYHKSHDKAQETARVIEASGVKPLVVQGDVSQEDDWRKMLDVIIKAYGRIDILVNNAAIFYRTPFLSSSLQDWQNFMKVNLQSVYLGCRIIGEWMYQHKKGKIINIADVSAYNVWANYIPYCVSKAGVIALTKGLAKALAPYVLVNAIAPGTILLAEKYDAVEEKALLERTPVKRIGSPADIAHTVEFLISGSDFITGAVINVDGGRSLT